MFFRSVLLLASAIVLSEPVHAGSNVKVCELLFQSQSKQVQALVDEDGYRQWLLWEQTANLVSFRKETAPIHMPIGKVSASTVFVEYGPTAPERLKEVLQRGQSVAWFKHPYNTADGVPFFTLPTVVTTSVYLTASRSLAFEDANLRGFTVKLPTDHPHGPRGEYQPTKADTRDDILVAISHSAHVLRVDREIGDDKELIILPEAAVIAERQSMSGAVIRDVRKLDDGYYYLPALSIPYVGREIAQLNGEAFDSFWKKNYAELLGRTKAKLLLRYGIQMETPNSQNMLIQFDRSLRPTGRIVFRDLSDAFFVDAAGRGLGFQRQMVDDLEREYQPQKKLKPFWSNSAWRFNEAGEKAVPGQMLIGWGYAHNMAYLKEIEAALGLRIPWVGMGDVQGAKQVIYAPLDEAPEIYRALNTDIGQAALKAYREKLKAAGETRAADARTGS